MKGVCGGGDVISVTVTWAAEKGTNWFSLPPECANTDTYVYTYT